MISSNELRLGNWVIGRTSKMNVEITMDMLRLIHGGYAIVEGVPLSPDILEKCGFEGQKDLDTYRKEGEGILDYFMINIYDPTQVRVWKNSNYCGIVNCQYLHQLQNLYFALTGQELPISL